MDIEWFLLGILVAAGAWYLVSTRRQDFKAVDWILFVAALVLGLFTIAFVGTMLSEPLTGAPRAAAVGGFLFGGITIVLAVALGRRLTAAR
jgi:hypothetical protein